MHGDGTMHGDDEHRTIGTGTLVRRFGAVLLLVGGLAVGLTACSDDGSVTGTAEGEVSASVTDDPSSTSGSLTKASFLETLNVLQSSGSFSGTMDADARVEIRTSSGTWIDLGSVSSADLAMQSDGGELQVASGTSVDAGSYTAVRLTLENATMTVDAGSSIGGIVLDASIDVDVGGNDNRVVIEKQVALDVDAETNTAVVFDLNSEVWMDETTAESRTASDSEVQGAATAFLRASAS